MVLTEAEDSTTWQIREKRPAGSLRSAVIVAQPGGLEVQAALQALPGGLADSGVLVEAGQFGVLGGVQGPAQLPVGQLSRFRGLVVIDAGPGPLYPALQDGPGAVDRVVSRAVLLGQFVQPGQGSLRQAQPGGGLFLARVAGAGDARPPEQRDQGGAPRGPGGARQPSRTSGPRVSPWAISEITMAAMASTRIRSRCDSGAPAASVSGMDSAAASGTTPRVPAHDTTAGTGQDGRGAPPRRWMTADSGNTHSIRITISVPVTASASGSQAPPPDRARISVGSCRPMRLNTTLSSRKMTVW